VNKLFIKVMMERACLLIRLGGCDAARLHEAVMDVGGVDEGDAEAMDCNQLLRQLQARRHMALRRKRNNHGVQLPPIPIQTPHLCNRSWRRKKESAIEMSKLLLVLQSELVIQITVQSSKETLYRGQN